MIEVCLGLACQEAGSLGLLRRLEALGGVKAGQPPLPGRPAVVTVHCFGRCAVGPNARVQGRFHHNLAPEDAAELLQSHVRDA